MLTLCACSVTIQTVKVCCLIGRPIMSYSGSQPVDVRVTVMTTTVKSQLLWLDLSTITLLLMKGKGLLNFVHPKTHMFELIHWLKPSTDKTNTVTLLTVHVAIYN